MRVGGAGRGVQGEQQAAAYNQTLWEDVGSLVEGFSHAADVVVQQPAVELLLGRRNYMDVMSGWGFLVLYFLIGMLFLCGYACELLYMVSCVGLCVCFFLTFCHHVFVCCFFLGMCVFTRVSVCVFMYVLVCEMMCFWFISVHV